LRVGDKVVHIETGTTGVVVTVDEDGLLVRVGRGAYLRYPMSEWKEDTMTNWMELPHTYPDEEKVLRWTPYILELRQAVDALSRPTPAAPDEVTEAMVLAGLEVFYAPVPQRERIATIYRAMRAAAPNAQAEYEARHPEEPATPLGDAAWWRAQFEHEVHMRARLEEQLEAALARPAPPPEPSAQEPSEELRLLRALRDVVNGLGDTVQWRERTEKRGDMVYCNPEDCFDIADIQEGLAALDAAGEGK
jgi:hypothetical protein